MPARASERAILFLVGAVQFVNVLDFMMVMPLGPDFAVSLGIPSSHLGFIGGSYTAAAAVSGVAGALFLDKFDRRPALGIAMLGLVVGTVLGGFAYSLETLILARILAGLFGGPATSLSLSIIADVVPPERRGKAIGAVMGAFSVASVLGVPAGLELARQGGWRLPFFAVGGLGLVLTALVTVLLPSLRGHLDERKRLGAGPRFSDLFSRPLILLSYVMTATAMMGGFILIPNISAYVQQNLAYPRERLGLLYLAGGIVSFFAMRVVGRLVDRFGSFRVGTAGSLLLAGVLYVGFVDYVAGLPVMAIFVLFMLAMSFRNVAYNALTTKVPEPSERARFMSIQSAVQHLASAAGA
ncbi:MAG: MFS transporter, partial [Myxococcales bacterium]